MQHSIRVRLNNALLLYVVLPLVLCGGLLIWQSYVIQRTQALELQQMVARLAVTHVKDFIMELENELQVAIQLQDFATQDQQRRFLNLSKLLSSNPIYTQLALLNVTGREQVRVSRTSAITAADLVSRAKAEEFLQPVKTQKTYFGPVMIDEVTGEPFMTIAVPVVNRRTGLVNYVLVADIRLRRVWDQVADIDVGQAGNIYIVDSQGQLLAHRNPSLVLRGTRVSIPAANGLQMGLEGSFEILVAQPFALGAQTLTVMIERPLTEALPMTIRLVSVAFIYIFINLLAAFRLERIAVRLLVSPIEEMAKTAQAITAGDLSQRAHIYYENELGAFAHAFNSMTAKLQQSLEELRASESKIRSHRDDLEIVVAERTSELTQTNQQLEKQSNERKQIMVALSESEARFRTIADATPVPLIIVRVADGKVLYANTKFGLYQGFPIDKLIGQVVYQLFPDSDNTQLLLQKLEEEGAVHEFEMKGRRYDDGTVIWSSVTIEFISFNGEHAFFGAFYDITARKLAEDGLARKAEELSRSNAELERFAYIASHDLQEPLRMVSSYVQLLGQRYRDQLDSDADEFIEYAVDGTRRMQILINDLLAYSRVSTKGKPFAVVNCQTVFNHAVSGLEIAIEEAEATITHDPLPFILADEVQMLQLFQNLLGNAIKFRGKNAPMVHVGVKRQDDQWLFAVRDNGIGLEPQFAERIFIIFQRLHNKVDYPGTGIGLALCKKIVERHGGAIWVESQLDQGATFYFTLPAAPLLTQEENKPAEWTPVEPYTNGYLTNDANVYLSSE